MAVFDADAWIDAFRGIARAADIASAAARTAAQIVADDLIREERRSGTVRVEAQ